MLQTFEAIWSYGKIIPQKSMNFKENTHLKIIVLDDQSETKKDWRELRGKFKGKLSAVDDFNRNKKNEKSWNYEHLCL